MAQVTFIASNQVVNNTTASTSIVVNKPTGTVDGDVLIAHISDSSQADVISTPSGWTAITSVSGSAGTSYLFYKVAASEGASYTFTIPAIVSTSLAYATVSTFRNANGLPVDVAVSNDGGASSGTGISNPGLTPTAFPDGLLVAYLYARGGTTSSFSGYSIANNNPSWTEVYDTNDVHGAAKLAISMAYGNYGVGTATGTFSATISSSSFWASHLVQIRPKIEIFSDVFVLSSNEEIPVGTISFPNTIFTVTSSVNITSVGQATNGISNVQKSSSIWTNKAKS